VERTRSEFITGEIKSGDAFRRYLGTAVEIGLLQELPGGFNNTKRGEILCALSQDDNPFKLNLSQSFLFLKILLEKDYDNLKTVVVCSMKNGPSEYKDFYIMLRNLWKKKLEIMNNMNVEVYDGIKKAINTKWNNPEEYYRESIKGPRLEWLLDLNMIDFWSMRKNRVIFRKDILDLLDSTEKNFSHRFIDYMRPLLKGSITYWKEIPYLKRNAFVEELLKQSFALFTFRPDLQKISANQLLEYGVSILNNSGVVCEIEDLDIALEEVMKFKTNYRYVKIFSEIDKGYISKL
jgi:hypothetical protein